MHLQAHAGRAAIFYSIRHLTKFLYDTPVSESMMETRMHPRSDANQRCLTFSLSVTPRCRPFSYRDHLGNHVHHFDIPGQHPQLVIVAESLVELQPGPELPEALPPGSWEELDRLTQQGDFYEFLAPSEFARTTPLLEDLANQLDLRRREDPLSLIRELNHRLFEHFAYVPRSTNADSPIDVALESRQGVCQDFAHIMIALVRSRLHIPCRYVSGYLAHRSAPEPSQQQGLFGQTQTQNGGQSQTLGGMTQSQPAFSKPASDTLQAAHRQPGHDGYADRSAAAPSATHAWVEVLLPQFGWTGFDPTNWLLAGDRHIRTAIGRDYADVPPTHGMFRGRAKSELTVAVRVTPSEGTPSLDQDLPVPEDWSILVERAQALPAEPPALTLMQQMAQQQ